MMMIMMMMLRMYGELQETRTVTQMTDDDDCLGCTVSTKKPGQLPGQLMMKIMIMMMMLRMYGGVQETRAVTRTTDDDDDYDDDVKDVR